MANTVARISHSTQVTTKCSLFWFSFIGPPISQLHKILTEKDKYQDICWSNPEMDDDSSIACKLFWQLVVEPQFVAICWEAEPLYYCAYHSMSAIFLIVNFLCVTRRSLSDDGDWVGQWVSMSCWISAIVLVLGSGNKASAFFRGKKMCCRWWEKEDGGEGGRVQRELRIVGKIYSLPQQQWTPLPWDNWLDSNRHKHLNTAIQTKTVIQTNTVIHNSTVIDTNTAMFKNTLACVTLLWTLHRAVKVLSTLDTLYCGGVVNMTIFQQPGLRTVNLEWHTPVLIFTPRLGFQISKYSFVVIWWWLYELSHSRPRDCQLQISHIKNVLKD